MKQTLRISMHILIWTVIGFLFAVPRLGGVGHRQDVILSSLAQWWSWGILSPLILWIDRRLPYSNRQLGRRVLTHLAVSPIVTILYLYLFHLLMVPIGQDTLVHLRGWGLIDYSLHGIFFLWCIMVYLLIVGVRQLDHYRYENTLNELRIERLERSFSEARLNTLRMQLNPHFLFNTLNMISAQAAHDPKLVRVMIGHLGDMLRASLDSRDRKEITLQDELEILEHYLAIQRVRFGDRLKTRITVPPQLAHALVPTLLLQPLVENAIVHGLSARPSGGSIDVTAEQSNGKLLLRIMDNGSGLPNDWALDSCNGLGLALTQERVTGIDPDGESRLSVSNRTTGGTEVTITLPLRTQSGTTS